MLIDFLCNFSLSSVFYFIFFTSFTRKLKIQSTCREMRDREKMLRTKYRSNKYKNKNLWTLIDVKCLRHVSNSTFQYL